MKNLYHKNKGKVHPSPLSLPSRDVLSVLKLLPAAILALVSILSAEDREVLAYLITRSIDSTAQPVSMIEDKRKCKKSSNSSTYKTPTFDCGCFDCYTNYWFKWDSSPNRELIHKAIEAFEEGERSTKSNNNTRASNNNTRAAKKRDKSSRRVTKSEKEHETPVKKEPEIPATPAPVVSELAIVPVNEIVPAVVSDFEEIEWVDLSENLPHATEEPIELPVPVSNHKGMARKFLPDVLGLFNSRIWNLWSPNI